MLVGLRNKKSEDYETKIAKFLKTETVKRNLLVPKKKSLGLVIRSIKVVNLTLRLSIIKIGFVRPVICFKKMGVGNKTLRTAALNQCCSIFFVATQMLRGNREQSFDDPIFSTDFIASIKVN